MGELTGKVTEVFICAAGICAGGKGALGGDVIVIRV